MDDPATESPLKKNRAWRWFKAAYSVATIAILAWAVITAWPDLQQWNLATLAPGILASVAGWLLMVVLLGQGWSISFTAWSGISLGIRQWAPMQASAWAGRYLPGKVGLLAGKMRACEQGASWKHVTASVISEQLAFVATGVALTAWALPLLPPQVAAIVHIPRGLISVMLLLPLALLLIPTLLTLPALPESRSWGIKLASWSLLGHLAAGLGFHALLLNTLPAPLPLMVSIGLLAAAHTAGVLAIFAPAGLGVREAVIASALAPMVGWPQAVAITALQRTLVIICDAAIALIAATALVKTTPAPRLR